MRNLTIKRNKTFVGCLAKLKVYVEDPVSNELVINGKPCRKLGELKNGEEQTFSIGEGEATVFVIAEKLSRNFSNDYQVIPAGQEDVYLSGQVRFSLGNNMFCFDGEQSAEKQANRKKYQRKGLLIIIASLILGSLIGVGIGRFAGSVMFNTGSDPKTFTSNGLQITLTEAFSEMEETGGFTLAYASRTVAVLVLKEDFSLMEGLEDYSLQEYGALVLQANNKTDLQLQERDGLTYFEYDFHNAEEDEDYHYVSYIYKGPESFWLVQFATQTDNVGKVYEDIVGWAKSVTFS